jgi:signal peptidase II
MTETTTPPYRSTWPRWLILSLIVLIVDYITKQWVASNMVYGESRLITGWFNLVSARNTGAAFSFLANAGGWQRWFFIITTTIITAALLWMLRKHSANKMLAVAYTLVIGGALGNLHDRVMYGYVIDFVQWHYGGKAWPSFNIADSAICLGVALLLIDSFRKPRSYE